jgi:hypothetical protein
VSSLHARVYRFVFAATSQLFAYSERRQTQMFFETLKP